jgi:hypothetical protein
MISPNNLDALADRPAFTRWDRESGTGWIKFKGDKKHRGFKVKGEPRIQQEAGSFAVNFTREVPRLVQQEISYCALPNGAVAVFSRWTALKDCEIAELVDHPFRWVEIEKFVSKPQTKQTGPGVWNIDGKLQMSVFGHAATEQIRDGINGAIRRDIAAKAGEVLLDSVCVYEPIVIGRTPANIKHTADQLQIGDWTITRKDDDALTIHHATVGN